MRRLAPVRPLPRETSPQHPTGHQPAAVFSPRHKGGRAAGACFRLAETCSRGLVPKVPIWLGPLSGSRAGLCYHLALPAATWTSVMRGRRPESGPDPACWLAVVVRRSVVLGTPASLAPDELGPPSLGTGFFAPAYRPLSTVDNELFWVHDESVAVAPEVFRDTPRGAAGEGEG